MITKDKLNLISKELDYDIVSKLFNKYEVNNINRACAVFATISIECNFKLIRENGNYSVKSILAVFPKYFKTEAEAQPYARDAQKLFNKVYANRYGNGDEKSGDGYKYRGAGYTQLTFKDNWKAFAKDINKSLEEVESYILTQEGSLESTLWFFKKNNIFIQADKENLLQVRKLVNGPAAHNFKLFNEVYNKYKKVLNG